PAKAGIAASAVTAAAAAVALVLALAGNPQQDDPPPPQAKPSTVPVEPSPDEPPVEVPQPPVPAPGPEEPEPEPQSAEPAPVEQRPAAGPSPTPTSSPTPPAPATAPTPTPTPTPTSSPPAPPAPAGYQVSRLDWDYLGRSDEPTVRTAESSWLWQRSGLRIGGRQYGHGVTVHAPSSVTIDLNRECTSYQAVAGVDDLTMGLGAVRFAVHGDGNLLWQSEVVRGGDQAVPVNVSLVGMRSMRLVVQPESPLGSAGLADWAESVISCR
ncbi:NPCBM/NEW2 domain-containing protein, partial [Streptomyces sparsus]